MNNCVCPYPRYHLPFGHLDHCPASPRYPVWVGREMAKAIREDDPHERLQQTLDDLSERIRVLEERNGAN